MSVRNILYKWLRLSERVTKTDMLYLAKGGYWLGLSKVIQLTASFVLALVFARILPKEVYGNYQYIISLAGLVSALMLSGMATAVIRSVARGFEGIVNRSINLYLRWSVLGAGVTLLASLYYFLNDNITLSLSLVIVSIGVPIFHASLLADSFLIARKNFKFLCRNKIILSLTCTGALIASGLLFSDSVPILVLTYFVSCGVTAYILMRYTLKKFPPNNKLDENDVIYGKHQSLMTVLGTVALHLDKVLVFQLIGAVEVAIYTFAIVLPSAIRQSFKPFGDLALPKLSASYQSRSFKNVLYKSTLFTLAIFVLVILYILFAELLFTIFFPAYVEAIPYSQVFALSLIPGAFDVLSVTALKAHRAIKKMYIFHISVPIIEIVLLVVLISFYGTWGAIFARLIGRSIRAVTSAMLLYLHKETDR